MKEKIALISYWILFILIPTAIFTFAFRGTPLMVIIGIAAFVAFLLLGEKGYREWKKIWKIPTQ